MAINPNVLQNITVPNEENDLYQINDDNVNISNQSIDLPPSALTFKNNIAPKKNNDSAEPVKNFFDRYFVEPISLPAGEVDAVIGFFEKRKFDKTAAVSVATILLQQAKLDDVDVFRLLDTLKGITDVQLSNVVTEILNVNRSKISTLGFKVENTQNQFEKRNIVV